MTSPLSRNDTLNANTYNKVSESFTPCVRGQYSRAPHDRCGQVRNGRRVPFRKRTVIEPGRPQVAGFEWEPPTTMGGVWLLAVVSAANDPVAATEQDIALLVQGNPKCGLKRVRVLP